MKIHENTQIIETYGDATEESFGIGNVGFIISILRDKLYSNIHESIVREYACNARDAHREIGTPNLPIEITLPNALDPNITIKDFGLGISPDRMSNIFLLYGNSSKRNDNTQTGGFGIGSKLGFSYTNQFSIISINNENDKNIKRTYIAYIDNSNTGKVRLVSEEIVDNHTGTEIIIPVEEKDFETFVKSTMEATKFWDVKPIIKGRSPTPEYIYNFSSLLIEGTNWKVYKSKTQSSFARNAVSYCIIDGIAYSIDTSFVDYEDRWIFCHNVHLYFNIGDLTLSASRESLQYDQRTIKAIKDRIKLFKQEFYEIFDVVLESKASYKEAVDFYEIICTHFSGLIRGKKNEWHGYKIKGASITIPNTLGARLYSYSKDGLKTRRTNSLNIYLNSDYDLYVNDIDPNHVFRKKINQILSDKNVKLVQIINLEPGKTVNDLISAWKKIGNDEAAKFYGNADMGFILELYPPKKLSSVIDAIIPKGPKIPKVKKIKTSTISGWKLKIPNYSYDSRDYFEACTFENDMDEYFIEANFKKNKFTSDNCDIKTSDLKEMYPLFKDKNIYAVSSKNIKTLGSKWKPLLTLINERYSETIKKIKDFEKKIALFNLLKNKYNNVYDYDKITTMFFDTHLNKEIYSIVLNKVKDKNSPALKINEYYSLIVKESKLDSLNKAAIFLKKSYNLDKYKTEIDNIKYDMRCRYPLLAYIDTMSGKESDIIEYINMADENFNRKNSQKTGT